MTMRRAPGENRTSLPLLAALTLALGAACLPTAQSQKSRARAPRASANTGRSAAAGAAQEVVFPRPKPYPFRRHPGNTGHPHMDRFAELWNDIHDPANGYFSPEGIPYHSVETLIVEAPDHGHETTSEAYSYWLWLEAAYGRMTGDYRPLQAAWENMEAYIIPTQDDQPTAGSYNYTHPAVFSPEQTQPSAYPAPMMNAATPGWDPLWKELKATYNTPFIYGMHWLLDVDNVYGYGRRGDGVSKPSYMNTFQRGMEESVWETVPQPSWEDFRWGGPNGYLDLFVEQQGGHARQWKYTNAPDADARAVQAIYFAKRWADEKGGDAIVDSLIPKAARMGDYLRYALFDKYFKALGCQSPSCEIGKDRESAHYLISWYYAWGGSISKVGGWSWRIGSSTAHQGYQNPVAAHVLGHVETFKPKSERAANDWQISLSRQLEVLRWLQSADGAIAGGVTNSWQGRYAAMPRQARFYGMAYEEKPVWLDPPSNQWFGFQVWGLERSAALYWLTGDKRAKIIMDRWVDWAVSHTKLLPDGSYEIPSTLIWSGAPSSNWTDATQNWDPGDRAFNKDLRVSVKDYTQDVGVVGTYARTLLYYGAKSGRHEISRLAVELLDRAWNKYRTPIGVSSPETRGDYQRFNESVFVPPNWKGRMPNGDAIEPGATFRSIRTFYESDPDWPQVKAYLDGGDAPTFTYHRFWAQVDVALANATVAELYPNGVPKGKGRGRKGGRKGGRKKKHRSKRR